MKHPLAKEWALLTKYAKSYLVIILLFIGIVGVLYYTNLSTARNLENVHMESSVQRGVEYLEAVAAQTNALALQVSSNSDVQILAVQDRPDSYKTCYRSYEVLKNFDIYSLSSENQSISMLVLYFKNGLIFNNGRLFTDRESFYRNFLEYKGLDQEQWAEAMENRFQFWPLQSVSSEPARTENYLTYNALMPLGKSSVRLCALISEQDLLAHFLPEETIGKAFLQILSNRDGTVLYDSPASISRENAYLVRHRSENLNLSVTVGIPPQIYESSIDGLKKALSVFSLFSILFILAALLFVIFRNFRPFYKLSVYLTANGFGDREKDPVNAAISSLSYLHTETRRLDQQIGFVKKMLKRREFEYLTSAGAAGTVDRYQIAIDSPCVLALLQSSGPDAVPRILSFLEESDSLDAFFETPDHLAVLLYPISPEETEELEALREKIDGLQKLLGQEIRCAASAPFLGTESVRSAYLEADWTLHKGDFSQKNFLRLQDVTAGHKNELLSIGRYHVLDAGLNGTDPDAVKAFYEGLEGELRQNSLSLSEGKQLFFILHMIVYDHMQDEPRIPLGLLADTGDYSEFKPIGLYLKNFKAISEEIVRQNKTRQSKYQVKMKDQILEYINSEYANPDLSLTRIADHFHVCSKYISDFIKDSTGKNYVDFIQEIRLSKALDLMKQQDVPLQQISEKVGYLSANTFYKSFRRYYGMSPSSFRDGLSESPVNNSMGGGA